MSVRILVGDVRDKLADLEDESVHCVVTSPPYWGLRDYGVVGQIGLEPDFRDYIATMVDVFREVRRVLRRDGTLWLNLGDTYATRPYGDRHTFDPKYNGRVRASGYPNRSGPQNGVKHKDLLGMPWRVAFALQEDGWWLRQDIIWSKPNPMPESVTDRCTKAHEYLFLLSKSAKYYYDAKAILENCSENSHGSPNVNPGKKNVVREDGGSLGRWTETDKKNGRNKRSIWAVATQPFAGAHFAAFPPALVEPCILAGCPVGGTVLDPFGGAGTTGLVADRLGRNVILIELNPEYAEMARRRIERDAGLFAKVAAD